MHPERGRNRNIVGSGRLPDAVVFVFALLILVDDLDYRLLACAMDLFYHHSVDRFRIGGR